MTGCCCCACCCDCSSTLFVDDDVVAADAVEENVVVLVWNGLQLFITTARQLTDCTLHFVVDDLMRSARFIWCIIVEARVKKVNAA